MGTPFLLRPPPWLQVLVLFLSQVLKAATAQPSVSHGLTVMLSKELLSKAHARIGLQQRVACRTTDRRYDGDEADEAEGDEPCLIWLSRSNITSGGSGEKRYESELARLYYDQGLALLREDGHQVEPEARGEGLDDGSRLTVVAHKDRLMAARRLFHLALIHSADDYAAHGPKFIQSTIGFSFDDLVDKIFRATRGVSRSVGDPGNNRSSLLLSKCTKQIDHLSGQWARIRQRRRRIALLTLCSYDANDTPLSSISFHNKVSYARHHGYTLRAETSLPDASRRAPWS